MLVQSVVNHCRRRGCVHDTPPINGVCLNHACNGDDLFSSHFEDAIGDNIVEDTELEWDHSPDTDIRIRDADDDDVGDVIVVSCTLDNIINGDTSDLFSYHTGCDIVDVSTDNSYLAADVSDSNANMTKVMGSSDSQPLPPPPPPPPPAHPPPVIPYDDLDNQLPPAPPSPGEQKRAPPSRSSGGGGSPSTPSDGANDADTAPNTSLSDKDTSQSSESDAWPAPPVMTLELPPAQPTVAQIEYKPVVSPTLKPPPEVILAPPPSSKNKETNVDDPLNKTTTSTNDVINAPQNVNNNSVSADVQYKGYQSDHDDDENANKKAKKPTAAVHFFPAPTVNKERTSKATLVTSAIAKEQDKGKKCGNHKW